MVTVTKKPKWLDKKISLKDCSKMQGMLKGLGLNTVCQEASCPNISECFSRGEATFMILGRVCTRNCTFCNVGDGKPVALDPQEPARVAEAVKQLGLSHVVITSVTRDDLPDGGAGVFKDVISRLRKEPLTIEVLIPDFKASPGALEEIVEAAPDIIGHNIETVPRLYKDVRPQADYSISIEVLGRIKELAGSRIFTKSGLMLGLGETRDEVLEVLSDLRGVGCDFLSLGQYLAPSRSHYPVYEYINPERFSFYKSQADKRGFLHVASAPYVRSSYLAAEYLNKKIRMVQ
ncbi:MAG: lipoyl synthase [Candidatus Omnitrophica bacterium]|nr:lipoyl synthase [Candidatus Omnitrophota bacterium]